MAVEVEPTAPPTSTGGDAPVPDGATRPPRRGWSPKRLGAGLAALAVLGAVLVFGGGSDEDPAPEDAATEQPATVDPSGEAEPILTGELREGYQVFTDPLTGISLQHPTSWVELQRPSGDRRVTLGTGNGSGLRVHVTTIEGVVDTPEELAAIRTQTDEYAGPEGVQVVQREAVEINGMLGISYLGRFTDEATGVDVVNAHFFLFKGNTMHNLLFQAVPEEDFERLQPDFNNILASFQGVPTEESPPPPSSE